MDLQNYLCESKIHVWKLKIKQNVKLSKQLSSFIIKVLTELLKAKLFLHLKLMLHELSKGLYQQNDLFLMMIKALNQALDMANMV